MYIRKDSRLEFLLDAWCLQSTGHPSFRYRALNRVYIMQLAVKMIVESIDGLSYEMDPLFDSMHHSHKQCRENYKNFIELVNSLSTNEKSTNYYNDLVREDWDFMRRQHDCCTVSENGKKPGRKLIVVGLLSLEMYNEANHLFHVSSPGALHPVDVDDGSGNWMGSIYDIKISMLTHLSFEAAEQEIYDGRKREKDLGTRRARQELLHYQQDFSKLSIGSKIKYSAPIPIEGGKYRIFVRIVNSRKAVLDIAALTCVTLNIPSFKMDVDEVKYRIQRQRNICISQQSLQLIDGTELIDGHSLGFYKIINESTIYLIVLPQSTEGNQFQIFVREEHSYGKIVTLMVSDNLKVESLKFLLEEKNKIPVSRQRLWHNGELLEDSCSLASYNIGKESSVQMTVNCCKKESKYRILVKDITRGMTLTMAVCGQLKIGSLKSLIEQQHSVPCDRQVLKYNGKLLVDIYSLESYNIGKNSKVYLTVDILTQEDEYPIFVRDLNGKTLTVTVSGDLKVGHLKYLLQQKAGIPVNKQSLWYNRQLRDACTLVSYHIGRGSTVHMGLQSYSGQEIFILVQDYLGNVNSMFVADSLTVKGLKELIEDKTQIPAKNQSLLYSGEVLVDNQTLAFYCIGHKSTICMSLKDA